jgi:hypothetical protein
MMQFKTGVGTLGMPSMVSGTMRLTLPYVAAQAGTPSVMMNSAADSAETGRFIADLLARMGGASIY